MKHLRKSCLQRRIHIRSLGPQRALLIIRNDVARTTSKNGSDLYQSNQNFSSTVDKKPLYLQPGLAREKGVLGQHSQTSTPSLVRSKYQNIGSRARSFSGGSGQEMHGLRQYGDSQGLDQKGTVESWDFLTISNEQKDYTVVILPIINRDDLNWDVKHELGSDLG